MLSFIGQRLLWFVPIVLVVIGLLFILHERSLLDQYYTNVSTENTTDVTNQLNNLDKMATKAHWEWPSFYVTWKNRGWSDAFLQEFTYRQYTVAKQVSRWTLDAGATQTITKELFSIEQGITEKQNLSAREKRFLRQFKSGEISSLLNTLNNEKMSLFSSPVFGTLAHAIDQCTNNKSIWNALPGIAWHGNQNRFHKFLFSDLLSGNARSKIDGMPIYNKIWPAVSITLGLNLMALICILFLGVFIGTYTFRHENSSISKFIRVVLYVFFAVPLFWLATVILQLSDAIPGVSMTGTPRLAANETPTFLTFLHPDNIGFILLPLIAIVLNEVVIVSIHMWRSLSETAKKKFALAAWSKGFQRNYIVKEHIRPASIFSIVTLVGNSIPALISGSIVIEIIFNIPGMGRLLWDSIANYDWSVVTGLVLIGVVFSVLGQLLADLTYRHFNPEVRI